MFLFLFLNSDHFDDFFLPELKKIGFDGWIQLKGFAPARQFGKKNHFSCF